MTSVIRLYGRQASLSVVDNVSIYHEGLRYLIVLEKFASTIQSESRLTSLKWKAQQKNFGLGRNVQCFINVQSDQFIVTCKLFSQWSNHVKRLGVYE